jgi:hypothetical protein
MRRFAATLVNRWGNNPNDIANFVVWIGPSELLPAQAETVACIQRKLLAIDPNLKTPLDQIADLLGRSGEG